MLLQSLPQRPAACRGRLAAFFGGREELIEECGLALRLGAGRAARIASLEEVDDDGKVEGEEEEDDRAQPKESTEAAAWAVVPTASDKRRERKERKERKMAARAKARRQARKEDKSLARDFGALAV